MRDRAGYRNGLTAVAKRKFPAPASILLLVARLLSFYWDGQIGDTPVWTFTACYMDSFAIYCKSVQLLGVSLTWVRIVKVPLYCRLQSINKAFVACPCTLSRLLSGEANIKNENMSQVTRLHTPEEIHFVLFHNAFSAA
jgi:hypothetical protein